MIPTIDSTNATSEQGLLALLMSTRMNLRRKVQHVTSGLLILYIYTRVITPDQTAGLSLLAAACLYMLHRLRLVYPLAQRGLLAIFGSLIRPHELYQLPGAFYLLWGCGLCILFFGRTSLHPPAPLSSSTSASASVDIPALCLLVLSVGDPLASFLGILIGKRDRWRIAGKSIIASAGMIAVCTIACRQLLITLQPATAVPALTSSELWQWSILASVAGALFEFQELCGLDDNFRSPLGTGIVLHWWRACSRT